MTSEQRVEAFRKLVAQRPDEPFARYSLAMAYRANGQPEHAAREFIELAHRAPGYVPTYLMLGQVLEGLGRAVDAAQAYRNGITAAAQAKDEHARNELSQALEVLEARGA